MAESISREAFKETAASLRLNKPVLAVLVAAVAFGGVWWGSGEPSWGALAALAAALALFGPVFLFNYFKVARRRVVSAERETETLRVQLADQRDPDGIYQLGRRVATGKQGMIQLDRGIVIFPTLTHEGEFNAAAPFEYRDLLLEMQHIMPDIAPRMAGRSFITLSNIAARITGRRG